MALKQDALLSLFIIDSNNAQFTPSFARRHFVSPEQTGGESVTYVNEAGNENIRYSTHPIQFGGIEISGSNKLPNPKLTVSNVDGVFTRLSKDYDDLIGFRLIRIRTFAKFVDKFGNGTTQSSYDKDAHFTPDYWYFSRKTNENSLSINYELTSIFDVEGMSLPRRRMFSNFCPFEYRGPECTYPGANVAHAGLPDGCPKTLQGCRERFGRNADLRYGGFPTVQG
ncbi:MAG: phage minor tail protein L [Aestuariivita sp.]|nr:phage minor tail protein L [Aestuariivita sp.]|tara:strand:- start:2143 stop:2817 length:675 start_codon:yes stop_codon:yes gene_type:complete